MNRVDFVQLMINAQESSLNTEQMEISLDDDAKQDVDEKKTSQAKGMILEVSKNCNVTFGTKQSMKNYLKWTLIHFVCH